MSENKIKVILDTDIGTDIDDALALSYLLMQPRCELLGITTLTGQAVERAKLASVMCHAAGRDDIPIFPGYEKCMYIEQKEKYAPQAGVLRNWTHAESFPGNKALQFMQTAIRDNPDEVVLLGISPMSNIARLFLMDPEIPSLLKGLYLMCGKFGEYEFKNWYNPPDGGDEEFSAFDPRNLKAFMAGGSLEMNALIDPHATALVYQNTCRVHRSVGIDTTHRVTMPMKEFQEACSKHDLLKPVLDMADIWFKTKEEVCFHDPLATVCIFNDNVCEFERGNVDVELDSRRLLGYTFFEKAPDGKHEVASKVNIMEFFKEFFSVFDQKL